MNTFSKKEKLLGNKVFGDIVAKGQVFYKHPFKIYYKLTGEQEVSIKIAFHVPKRNFKQAVKRNLIKRRLKEIYRLTKSYYYEELKTHEINILVFVIYTGKLVETYKELEKHLLNTFNLLFSSIINEKSD